MRPWRIRCSSVRVQRSPTRIHCALCGPLGEGTQSQRPLAAGREFLLILRGTRPRGALAFQKFWRPGSGEECAAKNVRMWVGEEQAGEGSRGGSRQHTTRCLPDRLPTVVAMEQQWPATWSQAGSWDEPSEGSGWTGWNSSSGGNGRSKQRKEAEEWKLGSR